MPIGTSHGLERALRLTAGLVAAVLVALAFFADRLTEGRPGFGLLQTLALVCGLVFILISLLPRRAVCRLVVVCASLIVGLLICEIGVRILWPGRSVTIYQTDPVCLHRYIPDSSKVFTHRSINGGHSIAVRINSLGYRGEEIAQPKRGTRLVVFGDSFVAAEFSALESTFVERLEAELGGDIEAVNAGVVAYGPDQILARMEHDLGLLQPDLAIVALFAGNDFGDPLRNKLFRLDEDGGLEATRFVLGEDLQRRFSEARRGSVLYRMLLRMFAAMGQESNSTMTLWLRQRRAEFEEFVVDGNLVVDNVMGDSYDADMSVEPDSESARYKARLMNQLLARMKATMDRLETPLVLVIIPSPLDLYEHPDFPSPDEDEFPHYEPSRLTDLFEFIAERQGIPVVNLFGPFQAGDAPSLYFRKDNHWNDAGQALAAQVVADHVRSQRIIETN